MLIKNIHQTSQRASKTFKKFAVLAILILILPSFLHAKELDSVTPPKKTVKEKTPTSSEEKMATPSDENLPAAGNSLATASVSAADGIVRLWTSFGPASLSVDGNDYNVGGASDITLGYKVLEKFLGSKGLWSTLRYAPFASIVEVDEVEYTGVMDGIFVGVYADYKVPSDKWSAYATAELGGFLADLEDSTGVLKPDAPSGFFSGLTLGGGANYEILEKFWFGPKLSLGFGGFTSWQLSLSGSFNF